MRDGVTVRYRKKPIVIEARQWGGTAEGASLVIDWILADGGTARYHDASDGPDAVTCIAIDTMEGTMRALSGDWVIKGVQSEFYPCKDSIFQETYEVA